MWVIEELVPDALWERIAPLLPPPKPRRYRYPGRRPIDDRAALAGIVFVLKTETAWNQLPAGLVGCSGVTCWRRLRDWTGTGVWPALHEQLLARLRALGGLDLDCCAVDGSHVRALKR
jgi:transposase